jgi:quinate/shikimate dehydrogenase (NAD+)
MSDRPAFLVGLIGARIAASRSPAMHESEADALGLRYLYRRIDLAALGLGPEALPELLIAAERMGFAGLNITHPCKQLVVPLLDELAPEAREVGAVNTVVFNAGRRIGHNTDGFGFAEAFRRGLPDVARARAVQLGAGGAGVAVAHAALGLGVGKLAIYDIDPGRAARLAAGLEARFGAGRAAVADDLGAALGEADGLIHCTPTGMTGHPGLPLPAGLLRPGLWVAEIVYFPLATELLRAARARGCRTLDGGGMAVWQAVEAFRLFTGLTPDPARMRRTFEKAGERAG